MSSEVTDHELTSSSSSLLLWTMVTSHVTSHSAVNMTTEIPYEEMAIVKVAVWMESICVPLIVAFGVLGNFLCFVTLVFTSLRNTSTCVYMAVIAVLDSTILVLQLNIIISRYVGYVEFYVGNDWACSFHYFLIYFSIHSDVLLLLAMTVDRFIVVKFPLKAPSWCTPKSALKITTGIGIFSFALNFQIFFNRRLIPSGIPEDPVICWYPEGDIENFMEKIYTIIDASIYSFIPFVSLLTLNLLIIMQLKSSRKFSKQFTEHRDAKNPTRASDVGNSVEGNTGNSNINMGKAQLRTKELKSNTMVGQRNMGSSEGGETASAKKAQANTNIVVMLLLVSFAFLVLTSPVVIVLLYERYYWQPSTKEDRANALLIHAFVDNIMYTNHAINFLLYCISGQRFRQELKQLLKRTNPGVVVYEGLGAAWK
ncbi:uncharacterized protein LOC143292261 [Babylonia areolata]|uniref:uncharacterized protein LOC143292261 n=1 Tax=Babylonia areolata TaxID=304850 RepID=UPI003FD119A8